MSTEVAIPPAQTLIWPTIEGLRSLDGSGTIAELNQRVAQLAQLTEAQQSVPHGVGNRSEVEYRMAWARTNAKLLGLVENSERAVWSLTELGRKVTLEKFEALIRERRSKLGKERRAKQRDSKRAGEQSGEQGDEIPETDEESPDWQTELLDAIKRMRPDAFERLAKRLLREAGFVNVTVTGGSGDGGIDGTGVYRVSLVSFPVYFQCKRYQGSVGASKVRDFRGAMVGRGDKGLLITSGTFTPDARAEATRDGAPPIDLIDGEQLADLLRQYSLGVTSVPRTVYDIAIHSDFFESL